GSRLCCRSRCASGGSAWLIVGAKRLCQAFGADVLKELDHFVHAGHAGGGNRGAFALFVSDTAQQVDYATLGCGGDRAARHVLGVQQGGADPGGNPGVVRTHTQRGGLAHAQFIDHASDFVDFGDQTSRLFLVSLGGHIPRQQGQPGVGGGGAATFLVLQQATCFRAGFHDDGFVLDLFACGATVGSYDSGRGGSAADHQ